MAEQEDEVTKINILANVDSYFGEHQGRLAPWLAFLGLAAIPPILYAVWFIGVIPFKYVVIFEVLFVFRIALKILGKEKQKLKVFIASREDEYAAADDIIRVTGIQEDGLVEFENGIVMFIISACTRTYFNEDELARDLETFLHQIDGFEYDVHCHLVVNETRLQDSLEGCNVYSDKKLLEERMQLYVYQDEKCSERSQLYRINILVKSNMYNWKKMKAVLTAVVNSSYANVFKECYVCDAVQAKEVMSRDLFTFIDFDKALQRRYNNEEYYNSTVYKYGESNTNDLDDNNQLGMEKRRVVENKKKE